MIKILNIVGARPNFMKMAPIIKAIDSTEVLSQTLIHTGQHYDDNLSKVFFEQLGMPRPDLNLEVGSGTRDEQIATIMKRFDPLVATASPDLVTVVGDVNSTVACARVAAKYQVPVAHVEAGLRSFDLSMPEEHNRKETDELSSYLFVTEQSGIDNLEKEQVSGKVFFVGNLMIDTLIANLEKAKDSSILSTLGLTEGEYFVSTFHRPSNVDEKQDLENLIAIIEDICGQLPLVLPFHPRTAHSLERYGFKERLRAIKNLRATEPLGYLDFLRLVQSSRAVFTDSGGIQEETTYLKIPCITMRENTERPVTLTEGSNVLVGRDRGLIRAELIKIMNGQAKTGAVPQLWDGRTASRIVEHVVNELS